MRESWSSSFAVKLGKYIGFFWKKGCPMSVREVQRALHFSSPSVAQHHLDRLCELGLVQKQSAGRSYLLTSEVKIGCLGTSLSWEDYCFQDISFTDFFHNILYNLPNCTYANLFHCFFRSDHLCDILVWNCSRLDVKAVLIFWTRPHICQPCPILVGVPWYRGYILRLWRDASP